MNKWIKIGSLILFIVIILQSIMLVLLKKRVDDISNSEQEHYSEIIQSVLNIDLSLQNTLNDELAKTHLTKDVSFKLDKVTKEGYTLDVRAELSRLNEDSKVMFLYKDTSSKEWTELEMENTNSLSYNCNIAILPDKEYNYKIATVGKESESGDVEYLNKEEFLPEAPYISGYGSDNNNLNIVVGKDLDYANNYDFKIKKLEAIIESKGKEKSYEFKKSAQEMYDEEGNSVDTSEYYEVNIPKDGIVESVKMKVTYDNGLIDIKDITYEIEEAYLQ